MLQAGTLDITALALIIVIGFSDFSGIAESFLDVKTFSAANRRKLLKQSSSSTVSQTHWISTKNSFVSMNKTIFRFANCSWRKTVEIRLRQSYAGNAIDLSLIHLSCNFCS